MNNVTLFGRLTKDPELKYTQTGTAITKITIAVDRYSKGVKTADFITCTAFNKTAETIANHFLKGNKILVTASVKTGSYDDKKTNKKVYTTDFWIKEFEFAENNNKKPQAANNSFAQQNSNSAEPFFPIDNEDVPF